MIIISFSTPHIQLCYIPLYKFYIQVYTLLFFISQFSIVRQLPTYGSFYVAYVQA